MEEIKVTGLGTADLLEEFQSVLGRVRPRSMGVVAAFLSYGGAVIVDGLLRNCETKAVRLIAGVSGAITEPRAISYLLKAGCKVRFGKARAGIFHPKLFVGGNGFDANGTVESPSCAYMGSANFSVAAFRKNTEVALCTDELSVANALSASFGILWNGGADVTATLLAEYEETFARRQRNRSPEDLDFFDIVATEETPKKKAKEPLFSPRYSNAVWVGLETFTGEHTLQVEFPKKAAEALIGIIGKVKGKVPIECVDGEVREMQFSYYENAMYRLNVPNDVPLVSWVRANKRGALFISREHDLPTAVCSLEIVHGRNLAEIIEKSKYLGTWDTTPTREYGWF